MTNPICVYDFTLPADTTSPNELKITLQKIAKKWAFQTEVGESGYIHYQGRFSLKLKKRLGTCKRLFDNQKIHLSPTSNENKTNNFYVTKEEGRMDGPWSDKDYEVIYIPRQIREIEKLYPWQNKIVEISSKWDTRTIHVIIDNEGNKGKSILCQYMMVHKLGRKIPFCNDYKDLMRIVCDVPTSNCYLFDIPRAITKKNLYGLFSAIEEIKGGYAWDDRHRFREKYFDCPQIFVFLNIKPETKYLSQDRWKLWSIEDNELIRYAEIIESDEDT